MKSLATMAGEEDKGSAPSSSARGTVDPDQSIPGSQRGSCGPKGFWSSLRAGGSESRFGRGEMARFLLSESSGQYPMVQDPVLDVSAADVDEILLDPAGEAARRALGNAESRTIHCINHFALWEERQQKA